MDHKLSNLLSVVMFTIGAILGMLFNGFAFWADLEASMFDSALQTDEGMRSLRCPILINSNETGRITAKISNPLDRTFAPNIRAHVSKGFVTFMDEINDKPSLAPHSSQTLEWKVSAEEAVWGHFILFRVTQFRAYPAPSYSGACGVLTMNLPLPGKWFTAGVILVSVLGMGAGLWLWISSNKPVKGRSRDVTAEMAVLGTAVLVGIFSALAALTLVGLLSFILSLLLVVVILANYSKV